MGVGGIMRGDGEVRITSYTICGIIIIMFIAYLPTTIVVQSLQLCQLRKT